MTTGRKRLGEILLQAGVINDAQLRAALSEQRRWGGPLGRILVDMKILTEDSMVQALSHQMNFPAVNLDTRTIDHAAIDLVAGELAEKNSVVPFQVQGKFLDVAMSDPTNLGIIDELRIKTRLNVRPHLAGPRMIERALAKYYGRGVTGMDFGDRSSIGAATGGDQHHHHPGMANTRMVEFSHEGRAETAMPPRPAGTPPPLPTMVGDSPSAAAARRAHQFELAGDSARNELSALQQRVATLESLLSRDEDVLRKLLAILVEKGIATREEIRERLK